MEETKKLYTPDELLVMKWKRHGFIFADIKPEHELEYAKILEEEAKKLIAQYGGGKKEAPNIWPQVERDFKFNHGYPVNLL